MKALQGIVAVGLCLVTVAMAGAQAESCEAVVVKKSMKASARIERGWDILFDVTVSTCAARGTFEYVVDLSEKGKIESRTRSASFRTKAPGTSTITIEYGAPAFKDLTEVRDVKAKTCTCGS